MALRRIEAAQHHRTENADQECQERDAETEHETSGSGLHDLQPLWLKDARPWLSVDRTAYKSLRGFPGGQQAPDQNDLS